MCLADSVVQIGEKGRTHVQVRSREDDYKDQKTEFLTDSVVQKQASSESYIEREGKARNDRLKKVTEKFKDFSRVCSLGDIEQVKQIVKKHITDVSPGGIRIDINGQDQYGNSPLINACRYGRKAVVEFLLTIPSINLNIKDENGTTALIAACGEPEEDEDEADKQARADIVQLILKVAEKEGVELDLNAKVDILEWTALMFASASGNEKIVKILIDAGAKPKLTDLEGKKASDIARTDKVRKLLEGKSKT